MTCQTASESKPNKLITSPQKDSLYKLKLCFVGDIMGHDNQLRAAAGKLSNMKSKVASDFDYTTCFQYVQPILKEADLAIGNLELTLNGKGRYTGYPMFRSPDVLAKYLKEAGFDLLNTCNNHSNDGLAYGVTHTIEVLDSLDLLHTGTFKDSADKAANYPLIVERVIDSVPFKLAFLSYTYATNGVRTRPPTMVNRLEQNQMYMDLVQAKAANPDMIIALLHWGKEYRLEASEEQKAYTQFLWENGVDLVIGSHPHVIQPIEVDSIKGAAGEEPQKTLVAYSLGNFISNQYRKNTDMGLILEVELIKNTRQQTCYIGNHQHTLAWRYIHGRYQSNYEEGFDWTYAVVPAPIFEQASPEFFKASAPAIKDMKAVTERMRVHLKQSDTRERILRKSDVENLTPLKIKQPKKASKAPQ